MSLCKDLKVEREDVKYEYNQGISMLWSLTNTIPIHTRRLYNIGISRRPDYHL